jgi:hypothetical protein
MSLHSQIIIVFIVGGIGIFGGFWFLSLSLIFMVIVLMA